MKYLFILSLLGTKMIHAQALPQHNEFQELGISFDIPAGWSAYVEGEAIIMGHQSISGLMIMTENTARSVAELKQLAQQGIVEQNIQLQPIGGFLEVGNNRLEGIYQGMFNGESVKAFAMALIDGKGKGVNILILTTSNQFIQVHQDEAKKLAASVKFFQAVDSADTQQWKQYIIGQKLTYMHTSGGSDYGGGYSGISDKVEIKLCPNGQFSYYSNSHSSFNTSGGMGYVSGNESNVGTYKISTITNITYLTLSFNDGQVIEYALTTNEEDHTLLNERRYFVTDMDPC